VSGNRSRDKGGRGEREIINLLQPIVDSVYADYNARQVADRCLPTPQLKRTSSMQADGGGCDTHGIDWLALEVKRCETLQIKQWWAQCLKQAKPEQMPVLVYRQNRKQWRARLYLQLPVMHKYVVADIELSDFVNYFADCLFHSLKLR
jgi:hypothetical protein